MKYLTIIKFVLQLKYCGRGPLAAPAVGIASVHKKEAEFIVKKPFEIQ